MELFRLTASRVARDKPWSTLCKKSHGIPISPRAAAVAKFRLLTGHDCLCAHLFRFNLVTSPICVLCDTGQDMTAAHLDECSALNDLNCIVKRDPEEERLRIVEAAAAIIREVIWSSVVETKSYPPPSKMLDDVNQGIPKSLLHFLQEVITKNRKKEK
ncbi:uncharacterized protein TNCV_28951 [Trichonephila clavipes]|nr:uncharacterized protein TNCV_28951 [Trichonephila clavipes]